MDIIQTPPGRSMSSKSQKGLELRKFFAPFVSNLFDSTGNGRKLIFDGALDAYSEVVASRLSVVHSMVSLVDGQEQYFLAGTTRTENDGIVEFVNEPIWHGCSSKSTPDALCEETMALNATTDCPCFIVSDLSKDERFAQMPVVDGSVASYRFYAGTPITTNNGINIGTFFVFDNKPRDRLTLSQRKFLHQSGINIMRYLETQKQAAERRRAALMSRGMADFLERIARTADPAPPIPSPDQSTRWESKPTLPPARTRSSDQWSKESSREGSTNGDPADGQVQLPREEIKDKIHQTMKTAANILRQSLEVFVGGVVFLDTAIRHTGNAADTSYGVSSEKLSVLDQSVNNANGKQDEQRRVAANLASGENLIKKHVSRESTHGSSNMYKVSKVQAISTASISPWDAKSNSLDGKTLQHLIDYYPKGNVWYRDDDGYFASLEQVHDFETSSLREGWAPPVSKDDLARQQATARSLLKNFEKARQIMFVPLWDFGGDRWYSGCFVWSQSATPVFNMDSEVTFLLAFTTSVMVEISRLDTMTASKMKSDFISSISHEFRSPLHGILASTEFLKDSDLDASQIELLSTVQNCSGTLLDTINHVLDYSKINSFENGSAQAGMVTNELYHTTNVALLCEDIINGMIIANEFRGAEIDPSVDSTPGGIARSPDNCANVRVVLDIEHLNWDFRLQAGALRRVIMNIFGNAQKYTYEGSILIRLGVQSQLEIDASDQDDTSQVLSLLIKDTGRGMSSEYMERKLYHPFAQEDNFSTGIGLGLSIVWSIINQMGGKIHIQSDVGEGTEVEVTLPLERSDDSDGGHLSPSNLTNVSIEGCKTLRNRVNGMSVRILHHDQGESTPADCNTWSCIERYCVEWFGYRVTGEAEPTDLLITDNLETISPGALQDTPHQRLLIVHQSMMYRTEEIKGIIPVASVRTPVGPFKLARSILALLDQDPPKPLDTRLAKVGDNLLDRFTDTGDSYGFKLSADQSLTSLETLYGSKDDNLTSSEDSGASTPKTPNPALYVKPVDNAKRTAGPQIVMMKAPPQDNGTAKAHAELKGFVLKQPPSRADRHVRSPEVVSITPQPKIPSDSGSRSGTDLQSTAALKILAVDDNSLNLQLLHRFLLRRKGDTSITAKDGIEAVAAVHKAAEDGETFDVILMDISMPGMDGFEATKLIRTFEESQRIPTVKERLELNNPVTFTEIRNLVLDDELPEENEEKQQPAYIVALTGLGSRRDRNKAEQSGFDEFLTKPISFVKIGELLERLSLEKGRRMSRA